LNAWPEPPADLQRWEQIAARLAHVGLYVLMFVVSLAGWMVATTFRVPMTQRFARDRRTTAGYRSGSVGAAVDRRVAYGFRLCACRGGAHPYRRRAASPHCQAQ